MMQTMTRTNHKATWGYHFGAVALIALSITAYSNARAESSMVDLTFSPTQSSVTPTVGIGVYSLKDVGPGFYMNGSLGGSPDSYYSGSCYYSCGSVTSTQQSAAVFAIGATFPLVTSDMRLPISRPLHSYGGLGYGSLFGLAQIAHLCHWFG